MANRSLFRYRFANAEFNEARQTLTIYGVEVRLMKRARQLLLLFLKYPRQSFSKEELLQQIWGERPAGEEPWDEGVVPAAMRRLRMALGPGTEDLFKNVRRTGYILEADVEAILVDDAAPTALEFEVDQPVPHRPDYLFVQDLSKGRRSNVWLARHVALPHTRVFKFAFDSVGLDALEREYTLLRVLERAVGKGLREALGGHLGVVTLLHGNFKDRPYFLEFEYGGADLSAWAGGEAGLGALDQEARLALFLQLAQTVAAAHCLGVIHRDLKPANVLVCGKPSKLEVRLADFGSGQAMDIEALEELELTLVGLNSSTVTSTDSEGGTFHYLAPEIFKGEPFTLQTDVFALGLILFQLLVGDFQRQLLPGWDEGIQDELLREIILDATQTRLDLRTRSAGELVQRLISLPQRREALANQRSQQARLELIEAERAESRNRLRRYALAGGVLVLSTIICAWLAWRAINEKAHAEAEGARAQAISDFMTKDVLRSADVSRAGSTESITMYEVLRRASEKAGARFANQPLTEAVMRCQLGDIMVRSIAASSAIKEYQVAIEKLHLLKPVPESELLRCQFGLAHAFASNGQEKEAEALLLQAEQASGKRLQGPVDELTLAALRARHEVLSKMQRSKEAVAVAQKLVDATRSWSGADLADQFESVQLLAEDYLAVGDEPSANKLLDVLSRPPYSKETVGAVTFARARLNIGQALIRQGKPDEAIKILRAVRGELTAALGPDQYQVGLVNFELANALSQQGIEEQEAYDSLVRALAAFTASVGPLHGNTVTINMNLGLLDIGAGRAEEGLKKLDDARPFLVKRGFALDGVDFHRARALIDLGRSKEALDVLNTVKIDALVNQHKDEEPLAEDKVRLQYMAERGRALAGAGQREEGRKMLEDAIAAMRKIGVEAPHIAQYQARLEKL